MKKNFKAMMLGLVLVGGLNLVGCQSTQDVEDTQEPEKVKIEVPVDKEEKEIDEKKEEKPVEEPKKEEVKEPVKKEEPKKEEMGQCYDCGEYYPVKNMTFNGRSYHCGCADDKVYCGYCGEEGHTEESCEWKVYDEELDDVWVCPNCGRENVGQVLCECELEELR